LLLAVFFVTNGARDLYDYFAVWPHEGMTRVLYRADYREASRYLDARPEIADIAVSSTLLGPWDRLALDEDIRQSDVGVRLFDPGRALVWSGEDANSLALLTSWPYPAPPLTDFLDDGGSETISPYLTLYTLPPAPLFSEPIARFANGLELMGVQARAEGDLLTFWRVAEPLDLPPMPIVANPPPPGVYSGPRLKVFAHLLAVDGTQVAGDDGLWVDPLSLQLGDRFVQVHRFTLHPDVSLDSCVVRLGLYDPKSGEEMRWDVLDTAGQPISDHVLLSLDVIQHSPSN
jgi:hypothetical protein